MTGSMAAKQRPKAAAWWAANVMGRAPIRARKAMGSQPTAAVVSAPSTPTAT